MSSASSGSDFFQRENEFKLVKIFGNEIKESAKFSVRHIIDREDRHFIKIGFSSDVMISQQVMQTIQKHLES